MRHFVSLLFVVGCSAGSDSQGMGGDSGSPMVAPTAGSGEGDVLVVPHANGVTFLGLDGATVASHTWTELVGNCASCGAEGSSPDGNGLLLSFTTGGGGGPGGRSGGIARVDLDGNLDFRLDGFAFPHDVIRDPADNSVFVVETLAHQLTWIAGDGGSDAPLRTLGSDNAEFIDNPNGAERLDYNGRTYVVVSHRPASGRITMWDITTPDDPTFVWRFPATGSVGVPHCPILREVDGQWWLLWAHTEGIATNQGSVGLAVTSDPTMAPTYVADLAPGDDVGPFTFLRGVELTADGRLFVTDSGGGGGATGRVIEAGWPDLAPPTTGETGELGNQVFEDLGSTTVHLQVSSPFEAWLWDRFIE
ncbi:MAG: hypothetical protein AAGA48_04605 [Myxococcota bacterium]